MCSSPFSLVAPVTHNVVGKLEPALEGARGNALVEHLAPVVLGVRLLGAAHGQRIFARLHRQLAFGEAGDRERDAVRVFAGPLDVVGRVGRAVGLGADALSSKVSRRSKPTVER